MRMTLAAVFALLASIASAQPQSQPLVQAGDVTHVGTVDLPPGFTPNGLAIEGDLIYLACYGGGRSGIATLRLPASGFGLATIVQNCVPLPNLNQVHIGGTYLDIVTGGALPWNGKVICSVWTYYDGGGGQVKSHYDNCTTTPRGPYTMEVSDVGMFSNIAVAPSRTTTTMLSPAQAAELAAAPKESLNLGSSMRAVAGAAATTWYRESMVGGYMGFIPPEWRALFGGAGLTGQCCVPIIGRTSFGPSVSVFDPGTVGGPEPVPSKMLVGYPIEHKTLGEWDASPPGTYYGGTDQAGSVSFPSGTRSVLFTERHGDQFCYGPATNDPNLVGKPAPPPSKFNYCFDDDDFMQGNHGPPYRPTMIAYDANDLLQVKQGIKKPWEVFPYAKWTLPGMPIGAGHPYYLRAGGYDDVKRRLYVGDTSNTTLHVFAIAGGSGGAPTPPVAANDTYTTASLPFTQAAPGVLANDSMNGNSDVTAALIASTVAGFTLTPNGAFTFAPASGFTGVASFTYQARSAATGNSNTATATVTVTSQSSATVTVDPAVTHQTMRGWEVVAESNQLRPDFPAYQGAALDKVVEAGFNRIAFGVRSGSEHTRDSFGEWVAAGHPATKADGTSCTPADGADPYCKWRFARYETINDNADPNTPAAGRFHWSEIDSTIDKVVNPLRAKLAAKGETLHVSLVYVSFYNMVTTGAVNVHQTPAEYAEFMLEAFKHMQARNGWVPDSIDTVLEPDNVTNWSGVLLGQTIAATAARFVAAGLPVPKFSAPSTTNMTTAPAWFDQLWTVTAARPYIKELSYHRYSGVSTTSLQAIASKAQAAGISTAMLEWWDNANTHETLHEDLTVGRNSAWQQNEIVNIVGAYPTENTQAISRIDPATPTVAVLYPRTKFYSQYYRAARMGAVRIGATSTLGTLAPIAFRNLDGKQSVVVKASGAASISIGGLPAGAYGITCTASSTGSPMVADLECAHPDQTITSGHVLTTSIPGYGVLTVIGKTGGGPPPVDCVGTWSGWARVAGSESACVASSRTFQERRDFTVTTPPSNGGAACPTSPEFRTGTEACTMTGATTVTLTTGGTTLTCTLTGTVWACK